MSENPSLEELLLSHAELRAALIFAGRRIGKLRRNDRSLPLLRRTLKEARELARQFKTTQLKPAAYVTSSAGFR